jgi:hypothetical protein
LDEVTIVGMPGKAWRSFEEAREFARSLGLESHCRCCLIGALVYIVYAISMRGVEEHL